MQNKCQAIITIAILVIAILIMALGARLSAQGVSINRYVKLMNSTKEEYYADLEKMKAKRESDYKERLEVILNSLETKEMKWK